MKKFKQALELLGIYIAVSIVLLLILFIYLKRAYPELSIGAAVDAAPVMMSLIGTQMMVIISILIGWKCKLIRLPECLKMSKEQWSKAALPLALGICWLICEWFANDFIDIEVPEKSAAALDEMNQSLLCCFITCIVAPLAEELFVREGLLGSMLRSKVNPWVAIIISALLFGVMHANSYQGVFAVSAGIIWGILYWKTGNIVITTIIHIINNTLGTVYDFMAIGSESNETTSDLIGGKNVGIAVCCVSAIFTLVLLVKFLKREKAIAH